MHPLERRTLLGAAGIGALAAMAKAGGPLDPPAGPVAPSGRTLEEIYAKVAAASLAGYTLIPGGNGPIVISQPGSYILTGNIACSGNVVGISILAHGVRLNLNSFAVTNTSQLGTGIRIHASNGTSVYSGEVSGFFNGIEVTSLSSDATIQDVEFRGNGYSGVVGSGRCLVVQRCRFRDLAFGQAQPSVYGVLVGNVCAVIDQCSVMNFATTHASPECRGINVTLLGNADGSVFSRCTVANPTPLTGTGINCSGDKVIVRDCTVINMSTPIFYGGAVDGGGNTSIL